MIGIDEVGRGAWAGPLLVCGARLKKGKKLPKGLKDSKLLSKKQREKLAVEIVKVCDIGDGWVSADMVDKLGLSVAMKSACLLAVLKMDASFNDKILLDGVVDYFKDTHYTNVTVKAKADQTEPLVSAASIVAKVLRDELLAEYDSQYPDYGFKQHVGYGTKMHKEAIKKHGVTLIHRQSFKPVKAFL